MFGNYKSIPKTNKNVPTFLEVYKKTTTLILCTDAPDIILKHRSNGNFINCYKKQKGKVCKNCKKSDPEKRYIIFAYDVSNNNKLGKIELSEVHYMEFQNILERYNNEKYFIFISELKTINGKYRYAIDKSYWSDKLIIGESTCLKTTNQ